jgi:hypothetical protein
MGLGDWNADFPAIIPCLLLGPTGRDRMAEKACFDRMCFDYGCCPCGRNLAVGGELIMCFNMFGEWTRYGSQRCRHTSQPSATMLTTHGQGKRACKPTP